MKIKAQAMRMIPSCVCLFLFNGCVNESRLESALGSDDLIESATLALREETRNQTLKPVVTNCWRSDTEEGCCVRDDEGDPDVRCCAEWSFVSHNLKLYCYRLGEQLPRAVPGEVQAIDRLRMGRVR